VDTWWQREGRWLVPRRPGPAPACTDPELLTLALAGQFLEQRRERAWRAAVASDWRHLFPRVPRQSEWNRRVRWLWGAFDALRAYWLRPLPIAPGGWEATDTAPLPITHPSRVRGTTSCAWAGPADALVPRFGYCAALARWFSGFRLALRTGLTDGLIRGWGTGVRRIVPAAVDERRVADGLLDGVADRRLLADQGFRSAAWARTWAAERNVHLLLAPSRTERAAHTRPPAVQQFVATFRNRIETANDTLKDRLHLETHLARTFWGLLTRTAAKIATYTFAKLWPLNLIQV
jgi:Transposase DDE domain